MSAFLGPIHHWLYNKIIFQEDLTDAVIDTAKANQWAEMTAELEDECGKGDRRPLEEMIDVDNIHMCLQSRIADGETRYGKLVATLLAADPSRLDLLKAAAKELGRQNSIPEDSNAADAFGALNNMLVDGMPCDNVNQITQQGEDNFQWQRAIDVHAQYCPGMDSTNYYAIRSALVEGMVEAAGLVFESDSEGAYALHK